MRVVQVSAHYPPNFTSGGTLVPQRIAQGLARGGHDSWVYAGHLDAAREPLETWEETDEAGVRVRWVVTTPWTAWSDDRNHDNPDVAADFGAWLRGIRPDVVHIHSLQTLGGGLVDQARAAGAAVVVTMHDFWWVCARQFLVAPDLRPCSLVVDCGECPCAVDHAWLERRDRALASRLAAADLVLAPSRSAARVMAANGVDPARLRVDENGVPRTPDSGVRAGPRGPADGPLRLLFAGGSDPMKGGHVLLRALERLGRDGAWTADLHGAESLGARVPGATVRPAFAPEELADVLAAHDVLVLPSIMRESHSILTREALAAGLAVVCSDTLGPEEAVDHGRNGLVVPAGDADALAAALGSLVDDRAVVARMRAAAPPPMRSVQEQVDGLVEVYREVLAARDATEPGAAGTSTPALAAAQDALLHRVLFVVGINGAPLRYRVHLAAEALTGEGGSTQVVHYRDPRLPDLVELADAVVLYRVPATTQVMDLVARVRSRPRPVPVLFDVDDLIFDPGLRGSVPGLHGLSPEAEDLWWRGVARYRTTLELADVFVGSTDALCEHATRVTGLPARRFPNGVGRALGVLSERALAAPRTPGPLRIGYFSGTTTHNADWALVEPAVVAALRAHPEAELWLGGLLEPTGALAEVADRVRRLPMVDWTRLPALLRDVDVNLAPLVPGSVFNEAKSAIKWLEAALVATPTVATPTQPFREVIDSGRTGVLASTAEEWTAALLDLLEDPVHRARVGAQARREALVTFSPHSQARVYRDVLREAAQVARSGPARDSSWEPVADDEPLSAAHAWVEPYPGESLDGGRRSGPAALEAARARGAAAVRVYRRAGLRGVAGRGLEEVGRRAGRALGR